MRIIAITRSLFCAIAAGLLLALLPGVPAIANDIVTIDRLVAHTSTVPAVAGKSVDLFVREKVPAAILNAGKAPAGKVALFVHGGYSPATLAFDVGYRDYSWMGYLARAGYDVFAMDMTGYGQSSRPMMDDPCNLNPRQQPLLVPRNLKEPCEPTLSVRAGDERQRDRGHRPRGGLHPRAARRREDHADRLVGRRHPHRHLSGPASREGGQMDRPRLVELRAQQPVGAAGGAAQAGLPDGAAGARGGRAPALARHRQVPRHDRAGHAGADLEAEPGGRHRSPRAGGPAACARRRAPIGAGTPPRRRRSRCRP